MVSFSALQRAEIAEIYHTQFATLAEARFSALQRAEIAEIQRGRVLASVYQRAFQCSSTSRNC